MVEFARYYISFLRNVFQNIGDFFVAGFDIIVKIFYYDLVEYFQNLINASNKFNAVDWLMAFLVTMINIAFVVFLTLTLYQLLKRYIKFVKREVEKDDLLEEVALLNQKTAELVDEKNKILSLKMADLGLIPDSTKRELFGTKDEDEKIENTRFVKLLSVDKTYKNEITAIRMTNDDMIGLAELVNRFIAFSASQLRLYYDAKIIQAFFAGMATSRLMILEGISGTGKTSLPYAMGKFFQNDADIIPVQPSWRDRAEMIGYLNEFTKKFNESDFLRSIYETTYREDPNFIVLDEMNLARVEYYFAEFLSLMEMPDPDEWKVDVVPDSQPGDPSHIKNGKLLLPQNVWFVGTANKDDSTFTISDKVYDRATPLEMNTKAAYIDAPKTAPIQMSYEYLSNLFDQAQKENPMTNKAMDNLIKLDDYITKNFKITFGNRIMRQIKEFVPIYVTAGGSENDALDYMVRHKILRKFEALNLPFLQNELIELLKLMERLFGKSAFKESTDFIKRLMREN
ncbi:MAG: hypothetical protein K9K93_05640 [Acholeplasmataceae bacterium]|nr:hypothetical protein [Acholeplasmataceae bacterium]